MKFIYAILALFVVAPGVSFADEDYPFEESWYLGGGLGVTFLNPDTNNSGYKIDDGQDLGQTYFVGYDYNRALSFELAISDFGRATLDGQGNPGLLDSPEIAYTIPAFSALWYFARLNDNTFLLKLGEDKQYTKRLGLQAFGKFGLGFIQNSGDVDYDQLNDKQLHWGGGLEYAWDNGFALRTGLDAYDKDAAMVYLSLLKRFHEEKQPEPIVVPEVQPVVVAKVVIPDDDQDTVPNAVDVCPATPLGAPVNADGCSVFDVALEGVNFETNSATLTAESEAILDEAADALKLMPAGVVAEVQAHTDSRGSDTYNLKLSERRAASTREYLVAKGVDAERLVSKGYGETQAIADNETKEGRAKNRRVELKIVSQEEVVAE